MRNSRRRAARALTLAGLLFVLILAAAPTIAAGEGKPTADPSYWVGRYCTTRACVGSKPSPLAHAAGFGVSVIAALWIAGRSSAKN